MITWKELRNAMADETFEYYERSQKMTREQAIDLARIHALAQPESYCVEPFQPHEWVVQAILAAANNAKATDK